MDDKAAASWDGNVERETLENRRESIVHTDKSTWERLWPVIACGAGLFSDGYLNGVRPFCPNALCTLADRNNRLSAR